MRLTKIIIAELGLLFGSVLIFRSLWILLDEYIGSTNLAILVTLLAIGVILSSLALIWINREVTQDNRPDNENESIWANTNKQYSCLLF